MNKKILFFLAGLESPFSNMARLEYEITSRGTTWVTDDGLQSSGLKHANDYSEKIIARGPQLWVIDFTEISEIQMYAEMHGYLYSQRGTHFTMGYDDVALVLIEQHRFDYDMMPLLSNCLTDDRFWLINAHGNEHCDKFSLCQFLYATAKQLNSRYLIDRVMQHELMWTFADLPECKFLFRTRTHEWQFKKTHASHRVPMVENDRIILHCELSETLAPLDLNTVSTGLWYLKPIEYECYSVHSLMDNVVASFESETDVGGKLNLLLLNTAVADIKLARGQPIAYIEKRISATPAVKIY